MEGNLSVTLEGGTSWDLFFIGKRVRQRPFDKGLYLGGGGYDFRGQRGEPVVWD